MTSAARLTRITARPVTILRSAAQYHFPTRSWRFPKRAIRRSMSILRLCSRFRPDYCGQTRQAFQENGRARDILSPARPKQHRRMRSTGNNKQPRLVNRPQSETARFAAARERRFGTWWEQMWADPADQNRRQKSLWLGLPQSGSPECELPQGLAQVAARSEHEDRQSTAVLLSAPVHWRNKRECVRLSRFRGGACRAAFSWLKRERDLPRQASVTA